MRPVAAHVLLGLWCRELAAGDAGGHDVDHRPVQVGFVVLGQSLVIADAPPVFHDPSGWVGRAARCQLGLILSARPPAEPELMGSPIIRLSSHYRTGATQAAEVVPELTGISSAKIT